MKKFLQFSAVFSICAVLLLPSAAAGKKSEPKKKKEKDPLAASTGGVLLYSTKAEIEMGEQVKKEVAKEYKLFDNKDVVDYVRRVGASVAAYAERQNVTYEFNVLDDPLVNAFALPGGAIYITRGILTIFDNEAELAGVLGHEVGHVVERHSMKQLQGAAATDIAWAILGKGREMPLMADIGRTILFMKFGRGDELKADALGLKYAYEAGYQADSMITVFRELGRRDESFMPEFLRTHPVDERRIEQIKELWALIQSRQDIQPGAKPLRTNDEIYAKTIFPHTYRVYYPDVQASLEEMIQAVSRKDLEGMMKHVAGNFKSDWLKIDYKALKTSYEERFRLTDRISAKVDVDGFRFLSINTVSALCRISETRFYMDGRTESDTIAEIAVFRKRSEKTSPEWQLVSIEDAGKW